MLRDLIHLFVTTVGSAEILRKQTGLFRASSVWATETGLTSGRFNFSGWPPEPHDIPDAPPSLPGHRTTSASEGTFDTQKAVAGTQAAMTFFRFSGMESTTHLISVELGRHGRSSWHALLQGNCLAELHWPTPQPASGLGVP